MVLFVTVGKKKLQSPPVGVSDHFTIYVNQSLRQLIQ